MEATLTAWNVALWEAHRSVPFAVWLRPSALMIRTACEVPESECGDEVPPGEIAALICSDEPETYYPPFRWFWGDVISPAYAGKRMRSASAKVLTPEGLGPEIYSDQSVLRFMCSFDGALIMPSNRTALRASGDLLHAASTDDIRNQVMMLVKLGFANEGWDKAEFLLHTNASTGFFIFDENKQLVTPRLWDKNTDAFSKAEISVIEAPASTAPEQYATVHVEVVDAEGARIETANATLYILDALGYAPRSQVQVVDGRASFKVGAIGLDTGDTVVVDLGWRADRQIMTVQIPVV